jgi:glycosyltransferase involved in cell wall biosynthesis
MTPNVPDLTDGLGPGRPAPSAVRGPLYVDVSPLLEKQLTGIGRFVVRLVEALAPLTELALFVPGRDQERRLQGDDLPDADADIETWRRRLWERRPRSFDRVGARRRAAVFTALRPDERFFRAEIGLLYDFTPLLLPWAHAERTCTQFAAYFGQHTRMCDRLLAISHSTKRDAGWLCGLTDKDVVVAYPGPSLCVHRHAAAEPPGPRRPFVLVVSTLEPRKNAPFLLDWFRTTAALDDQMELWWVGPVGWWASAGFRRGLAARRAGVRFLGMVSERYLCQLYQEAAFTIYPSLYEGFGFPALDALVHGTPVVCGFHSSLQEFNGPGVFFFDPCDPCSLDQACRQLSAAGTVQIDPAALRARFSWEALARTVLGLCA